MNVRIAILRSKYYLLQAGGLLICFLGMACFKIIPVLSAILMIWLFDAKKYELIILAVVGWGTLLFVSWPIGTRIITVGLWVMDEGKKYKYSYLKAYGRDFPEPKIKGYTIEDGDFVEYKRRFQLSEWEWLNFPRFSGHKSGLLYNREEACQANVIRMNSRPRPFG